LSSNITQPIGQPKTEFRMTAVPETPPGAMPEGARKIVSDTTINRVPAVINRNDCTDPFQVAGKVRFNDTGAPRLPADNNAGPFGYALGLP
jgi:hypothetical protein